MKKSMFAVSSRMKGEKGAFIKKARIGKIKESMRWQKKVEKHCLKNKIKQFIHLFKITVAKFFFII